MRKVTLVKIYAVFVVSANKMVEVFRNSDKQLCKDFKRDNKKMGKLAIGYVDNEYKDYGTV